MTIEFDAAVFRSPNAPLTIEKVSLPSTPPPGDVLVTFRLKFGTETIERIATGCALAGPTGNVFERLYNLVEQY